MPNPEYRVTCGVPRAFVPLKSQDATRDVMLARSINAHESPYPFALAIFESNTGQPSHFARPFQIFYVSSYVAKDRDPKNNSRNPGGVREGWYVVTKPETAFEVRYAIINRRWTGNILEDLLVTQLYVDGEDSQYWNHHVIGDNVNVPFPDVVIRGFCTGYNRITSAQETCTCKKFNFTKSKISESAETRDNDAEQGTIQLRVKAAQAANSSRLTHWHARHVHWETGTKKIVSEKAIAKEGKSLQIEGVQHHNEESAKISPYSPQYERVWTGAEITVYVRELSWMRSRRLIDDKGRPCTYTKYKELLQKDQGAQATAKRKRTINFNDNPRALKKVKTEDEAAVASANPTTYGVTVATQSGVIDLTKNEDEVDEVKDEPNRDAKSEPHISTEHQAFRITTTSKRQCDDIVDLT